MRAISRTIICLLILSGVSSVASQVPYSHGLTSSLYVEDLDLSLQQNTPALVYNVTAVSQCETGGSGPFYSLEAVSNTVYWCHFGIAWDWPSSLSPFAPGQGFRAIFSVRSTTSSVFSASDPMPNIRDGDIVQLSLAFSSGVVNMSVRDWNSSAADQQSYSAMSATTFIGNSTAATDSYGFFSGISTREYHQTAYYGDENSVLYTSSDPISSAWMRAVEFPYATTYPVVFDDYGSYNYPNQSQPQQFHTNGAFLASNATQFQTGGSSNLPKCLTSPLFTIGGILLPVLVLAAGLAVAAVVVIVILLRRRKTMLPFPSLPPPPCS